MFIINLLGDFARQAGARGGPDDQDRRRNRAAVSTIPIIALNVAFRGLSAAVSLTDAAEPFEVSP